MKEFKQHIPNCRKQKAVGASEQRVEKVSFQLYDAA
jgi:hypothetical protein